METLERITTLPGFDREKLEAFCEYADQNPNDVQLVLEAKTIWDGKGGESLGKIGPWTLAGQTTNKASRDFSIQFGAWKEVEEAIGMPGAYDRIEPVEGAMAALCACVNWAICINCVREGIHFDEMEIKAKVTADPRVLFGILSAEESVSCMQNVMMEIHVKGNLTEMERIKIKEMADRSPVHALIKHSNNISTTVIN